MTDSSVAMITDGHLLEIDLHQVIGALSDALDLVGIDDVGHGKRVAIMAAACARELGLDDREVSFLFDLGMLHDIGVSSTDVHTRLVSEFDWSGAQTHCDTGCALLREFAPLSAMAEPVRLHHTHWIDLARAGCADPALARLANLIYLVDRADALSAAYYADRSVLAHTGEVRDGIASRAGAHFDPTLVDAFLAASARESFWLQLEPGSIHSVIAEQRAGRAPRQATLGELRQLAGMFSRIVDAKSPFTVTHSLGVARVARLLADRMGVSAVNCDRLEIAGLLHDLGKLRIPDEILEKPGPLDVRERRLINSHSFETYRILRQIAGFEDITLWAATHHEEPDGSGYPFHRRGSELPLEARILRVADIFQAMVQNRPYRHGLPAAQALQFLRGLVDEGRVEAALVDTLADCLPEASAAALAAS